MAEAVWRVHLKGSHYLIVAPSPLAAVKRAEGYARRPLKVVAVERHVPARWPPVEQWAQAERRREAARKRAVARQPRPASPEKPAA
jgi:hypothetical protein